MSLQPANVTLTINQGMTFAPTFLCADQNGDEVDLTGVTATFRAWNRIGVGSPVVDLASGDGITITGGRVMPLVDSDGTAALPAGRYQLEVDLSDASSPPNVLRLVRGILLIRS